MTDYKAIFESLKKQEEELQFDSFNNDDAYKLGNIIYDFAKEDSLSVTIDITRGGQQLFHVALPGTSPDNDCWIKRKIKLVNRIQKSSYWINTELRSEGVSLEDKYELSHYEYAAHGGCVPVIVRNVGMVGTVTVSGLEQSKDHELVIRALKEYFGK